MRTYINYAESEIDAIFTVVGMAIIGGLANFFRDDNRPKWGRIIAALVTSAFSGLLSYEVTIAMGFDIHVQCIVAGVAGYGGGKMLDEFMEKLHDFIMHHADNKLGKTDNKS